MAFERYVAVRTTIQTQRYSAFDALRLINMKDDSFHCEKCDRKLVAESDKLAAEEMGDADDNARRRRPWEAANAKAGRASHGDSDVGGSSKTSQGQGYGGTPMPFLGETKVEVALSGVEVKDEDSKPSAGNTSLKDAFVKAYYTALAERQREQEAATREMQNEEGHNMIPSIISNGVSAAPSDRRVGMKSKREDDGDDDIEWEEALPSWGGYLKAAIGSQAVGFE
ncbi:hypothetical protein QJS10_CPA10g01673 [Acorus calamus]|uniref:Uncharacterized protein n=1 Tax=Acorus calamus TaxID=4465 RepID=A0AAV9DY58_ACOCL|nr:hypothetical protein QJS10_CPA10g01673 [Acorus calamus]